MQKTKKSLTRRHRKGGAPGKAKGSLFRRTTKALGDMASRLTLRASPELTPGRRKEIMKQRLKHLTLTGVQLPVAK
jgi:hypothetical protein